MKVIFRPWALLAAFLVLACAPLALAQKVEDRVADDQYNFATELFGKKLYELAIQQYEKFIEAYPMHPNAFRARIRVGESYLRLGKNEQAAGAYEKALSERPDSNFRPEILVGIGLARYNLKEFPKAVEALA